MASLLTADLIVKILLYGVGPLAGILFIYFKGYGAGKEKADQAYSDALHKLEEGVRGAEKQNQQLDYERDRQINSISDIKSPELLKLFNSKLWGRKDSSKPTE